MQVVAVLWKPHLEEPLQVFVKLLSKIPQRVEVSNNISNELWIHIRKGLLQRNLHLVRGTGATTSELYILTRKRARHPKHCPLLGFIRPLQPGYLADHFFRGCFFWELHLDTLMKILIINPPSREGCLQRSAQHFSGSRWKSDPPVCQFDLLHLGRFVSIL